MTRVFCTSGPNLVILAWRSDELSRGQAQNGGYFDFEVKFVLEGHGQSPPKTIGILTKVFYTYGPNMVILAWTGDELSCGQAWDYCTHRRTHRQTQATTIPEGQNRPRVKILIYEHMLWIKFKCNSYTWWSHQMETFSVLLALCAGNSPVTGEKASDAELWCFFDLCLNKRLSKQSWGWWFATPSRSLWRHCNENCSQVNALMVSQHWFR